MLHDLPGIPSSGSPDGRRFLIPRPVSKLRGDAPDRPIAVALNWDALLRR
jgi:hypothetical protein